MPLGNVCRNPPFLPREALSNGRRFGMRHGRRGADLLYLSARYAAWTGHGVVAELQRYVPRRMSDDAGRQLGALRPVPSPVMPPGARRLPREDYRPQAGRCRTRHRRRSGPAGADRSASQQPEMISRISHHRMPIRNTQQFLIIIWHRDSNFHTAAGVYHLSRAEYDNCVRCNGSFCFYHDRPSPSLRFRSVVMWPLMEPS